MHSVRDVTLHKNVGDAIVGIDDWQRGKMMLDEHLYHFL